MIKYTELKNNKRQVLRDIIPLKKPFTILIEPSNYCNFKCVSCFQSLRKDNYITSHRGMMDMNLYRKIIDDLKNWEGGKIKVLKLSLYGEPFTNTNFIEMLKLAKKADIAERIETTTNASLITEDLAKGLVENGIDYIRVSIYGTTQENYKKTTGSPKADLSEIINNLKYINQLKHDMGLERPFVAAKMLDTYSEENEEFIRLFSDVADEVYIDKPHNWVATDEKSFIGSLYGNEQRKALEADLQQTISKRVACPMAFTTLAIRSDGEVSPCCVDWTGGTNLGNIKDESLENIWNGDVMYEFRKMQLEGRRHENPSCKNCDLADNDYYTRDNIDGFPVEKLR